MFALMSSPTIMMSTQQRFKKFGKETRERRKSELDKIGDTFKGIAEDEKNVCCFTFQGHLDRCQQAEEDVEGSVLHKVNKTSEAL